MDDDAKLPAPPDKPYGPVVARLQTLAATKGLSDQAQEMVGLMSNLLARDAVTTRFAEFELQISVALSALEAEAPNIRVAREALYDIDSKTVIFSGSVERFLLGNAGGSPIAVVNAAMPFCCVLFVGANVAFYYLVVGSVWLAPVFANPCYFLATSFGFLASLISLMQRASIPSDLKSNDLITLFYTSIWKPMTAAVMAGFAYFVFEAGLILSPGFQHPERQRILFYCVVGFLVGFSERFAGDILTRTQTTITNPGVVGKQGS